MTTIITRTIASLVVPIVLVVALSLFFQGHDQPGGGFIGGVLTVAAFALVYVAYDLDYVEVGVLGRDVDRSVDIYDHRTVRAYRRLFVFGLVVSVASGLTPLVFDAAFLSQEFTYVSVPLFGEVELASALVFDVGIYCLVVGGLLSILSVVGAE